MLQYDTIHELQRNACEAYRDNELFGTFNKESGEFEWMTYGEFDTKVAQCRAMLIDMGIREYSKVGLISNNRWEWAALSSATYSLNGTVVPMYEQQNPSDWSYILNDSECDVVFCATQTVYSDLVKYVLPGTPTVKDAVCLDAPSDEHHAFSARVRNIETSSSVNNNISLSSSSLPTPDDLANLIYTSGTTGKPKGVELLHSNTISNVKAVPTMVDVPREFVRQNDRSLAFLPWAHSYGQTCELWIFMSFGAGMGICRGVPDILEDLQKVKPTVLFSVPTLYKKVYDGVGNLIESSSPLKQKIMRRAFALAKKKRSPEGLGFLERPQFSLLNDIVLKKVRDRFGGNLRLGFCAGAAVPREVLDFMDDVGIPVCEGYGLTETSPIIALNTPDNRKNGSVGRVLNGVDVTILGQDGRIVEEGGEGEICCQGPNVMRGYHRNETATDEVMTAAPDGSSEIMFHTGDLGRVSSDGFLLVTGRIKEQYKLENGKYVCPTPIEEAVGMSRFVSQVVLCGANRPYNVALIVPDWAAVRTELGMYDGDTTVQEEDLVNDVSVRNLIDREIQMSAAGKLKKFEIPQKWAVVAPFTAANNMLTPKMSIRRHMVAKAYENVVAGLYDDETVTVGKEEEDKVA